MVGLAQLVNDSLLRHGVETTLDPRRLQWSEWFLVESCFSFLRVPDQAGIFALAEEVIAPGETSATDGKRMLAIFRVSETDQLGLTMGRLFLPGGPEAARLTTSRCFARYAVVEDEMERRCAYASFERWLTSSVMTVHSSNKEEGGQAQNGQLAQLPAGF